MKKKHYFNPTEIIFAATSQCNLNCKHCYVTKKNENLDINKAIRFLNTASTFIDKVGFSGGEPFLYMDFLLKLIKETIKLDLLFDQIITNGDWWKNEKDLRNSLQSLYDAGYDGKFSLSFDGFHSQKTERICTFIDTVISIFGKDSINIQSVLKPSDDKTPIKILTVLSQYPNIPIFYINQAFPASDKKGWQSKKWFKDDYCEGPGQILYIHSDGRIAPCCGFANENEKLIIGTIDDGFNTVLKNAENNKMIKICYEEGLHKYIRIMKKTKGTDPFVKQLPGKTSDICTFCDFVCKNI